MAQAFVTTYRNHYRWHREPKRKSYRFSLTSLGTYVGNKNGILNSRSSDIKNFKNSFKLRSQKSQDLVVAKRQNSDKQKKPVDRHAEAPPPGDYWIDTSSLKQKEVLNIPYGKALVKQSHGRLMFSTYQMNYCTDKVKAKKQKLREAVKLAAGDTESESVEQTFENELLKYCEDLYSIKTSKIMPPSETARRVYGYIRPEDMYTPLTNYQMIYGKAGYDIMSNPSKYFQKRTDKDEIKSMCETLVNNPKSVFKKLEDIKMQSIQKEKQEREEKLYIIMENLDRCSNYANRSETEICCCDY